ncbi:MAG TPA: magnesium transporter [Candidatus Acutalibacter pullistercoris]|uniref:Magnesium transporter MgtE n=1 Tax=Candidatus Acutalibacter pullistercoris TaxID=2838418 RepID=A0A9D1YB99_9FIRM|nr:magnesium transporter [Candidatus Acutalibacter pullistercoris]
MQEKILQLLEDRKYGEIAALVKDMNPADAAAMLQELPESKMPLVFRLLPKELAAETFAYMEGDAQEVLIQGFTDKELDEVIGEMFLDDAVDMIEEMPANVVKKILRHVDADTRKMINQVLNYPKDSAGAMMTMEYVDLKRRMTVEQAFERIRSTALDSETVYTCYVTDGRRKLEGVITVRELLLAPKDAVLRDIMETNVKFVTTHTDQEEAARLLSKYDFLALPVVDAEERLVGIVTVDDAMDVMQEEATEDMERMAAIAPSDKPYMKVSVFENWKKRAPWLLFLMISAAFTGSIITHFETALAANLVLSSFIPMLMSTGGNTGSQASTTIIRSLSLGEVRYRDIPQILLKESSTAVLCGVTLAVANFLKLMLLDQVGVAVALVVCLTILAVSLVANLLGSLLPLFAKRVGLDPTVMASPLISTILDAVSLVIYFNIAVAVLQI